MKLKFFIFLIIFSLSIFSCSKNNEIVFDNSEPLALSPETKWAVVINPYVGFQKESSWDSVVINHARKGEILQVLGKSVNSENEIWYNFSQGWLNSSVIQIYSNRYKAEKSINRAE